MKKRILDTISSPQDIKALDYNKLDELASEIRGEIIAVCSMNGGHLASSLGAVELILAAHRVLDCPKDRILFDVGHQSYAHKIITGRLGQFASLRTDGGISGFPKIEESPFDSHNSGHASDSLSVALGYALARDLRGSDEKVLALIGDASISGGLAFEALNTMGQMNIKLTVLLNDNEMSISRNVGALSLYLGRARTSRAYTTTRDSVENRLSQTGAVGRALVAAGEAAKRSVKHLVVPGMLFEEMGLTYIGPINGHSIRDVEDAIRRAQMTNGPVIIHTTTRKGAGYAPAEERPDLFHGVGPFNIDTGEPSGKKPQGPSYTKVFAEALVAEAAKDDRIVAFTAAMSSGTGLDLFAHHYSSRCFDVGIAEGNAVAMASGVALGGQLPVVAIYSTFLQRAYDEIVTNVCLPNAHVVFAIDRGGVVGADGPTHHGMFDLSYLRSMPNMRIIAPSDEGELVDALHTALALDGPVALRYPRGVGIGAKPPASPEVWEPGVAGRTYVAQGCEDAGEFEVEILAAGRMFGLASDAADLLFSQGIKARVTDMRWVKPIDLAAVRCAAQAKLLVTVEEGTVAGGFGSGVLEALSVMRLKPETLVLGAPDAFVEQGNTMKLLGKLGLDAEGICGQVSEALARIDQR